MMPYLFVLVFAIGAGGGFFTEHQISKAEIIRMESAIQAQKDEAELMLSTAENRVMEAQSAAATANNNLDKAHDSTISAINAQHDSLINLRMRDPGRRASCPGSVSAGTGSNIADVSAAGPELSDELKGFLLEQLQAADKVAAYAQTCYQFVQSNCGISKE